MTTATKPARVDPSRMNTSAAPDRGMTTTAIELTSRTAVHARSSELTTRSASSSTTTAGVDATAVLSAPTNCSGPSNRLRRQLGLRLDLRHHHLRWPDNASPRRPRGYCRHKRKMVMEAVWAQT
jgi:hypothetical protein